MSLFFFLFKPFTVDCTVQSTVKKLIPLVYFFVYSFSILNFFCLIIRLSWHGSQIWWVNLIDSDFFLFLDYFFSSCYKYSKRRGESTVAFPRLLDFSYYYYIIIIITYTKVSFFYIICFPSLFFLCLYEFFCFVFFFVFFSFNEMFLFNLVC
jgi:hypothetical protein